MARSLLQEHMQSVGAAIGHMPDKAPTVSVDAATTAAVSLGIVRSQKSILHVHTV